MSRTSPLSIPNPTKCCTRPLSSLFPSRCPAINFRAWSEAATKRSRSGANASQSATPSLVQQTRDQIALGAQGQQRLKVGDATFHQILDGRLAVRGELVTADDQIEAGIIDERLEHLQQRLMARVNGRRGRGALGLQRLPHHGRGLKLLCARIEQAAVAVAECRQRRAGINQPSSLRVFRQALDASPGIAAAATNRSRSGCICA